MPTFDEIIQDLNIAKIFKKRDLTPGYHQLELVKNQDTSPPLKPMLELINTSDKIWNIVSILSFSKINTQCHSTHLWSKNISDDIVT